MAAGISTRTAEDAGFEELAPTPRRGHVEPGVDDQQGGGGGGRELHPRIDPERHVGGADDGEDQKEVEAHPGGPVVEVELRLGRVTAR